MNISWRILAAAIMGCILIPAAAGAQVVISVGVQEIYDDNIFLENENGTSCHADPRAGSERSATTLPSFASTRSDVRGVPDSILIQTDPS